MGIEEFFVLYYFCNFLQIRNYFQRKSDAFFFLKTSLRKIKRSPRLGGNVRC